MDRLYHGEGKILLLFITAILILGFLIVSCGRSPQQKVQDTDKGSFAVDFSRCLYEDCAGIVSGTDINSPYNTEITVEAWVKRRTNPAMLQGGIFGRLKSRGFALFVNDNIPKFAIQRDIITGDLTGSRNLLSECVVLTGAGGASSTECIVQAFDSVQSSKISVTLQTTSTDSISIPFMTIVTSTYPFPATEFYYDDGTLTGTISITSPAHAIRIINFSYSGPSTTNFTIPNVDAITFYFKELVNNAWTHIAGALTNEDHSSGPNNCALDTDGDGIVQGAEQPHLAIFINGELNNCADTGGVYVFSTTSTPSQVIAIGEISDLTTHGVDAGEVGPVSGTRPEGTKLNAVVDEVRYWHTARTEEEIQRCMNRELGISGDCSRSDPNLIGYWPLNEGEGSSITDFSGNGLGGALLFYDYEEADLFTNGWVSGDWR